MKLLEEIAKNFTLKRSLLIVSCQSFLACGGYIHGSPIIGIIFGIIGLISFSKLWFICEK